MKIRNSFVSNSSTTSFVLVGQPIKLEDLPIDGEVAMMSACPWGDAGMISVLDQEMQEYVAKNPPPYSVYGVYRLKRLVFEDSIRLDAGESIEGPVEILGGECNQASADDMDSLKEVVYGEY